MCEHHFIALALETQAWCVRCGTLQVDGVSFTPGPTQCDPPKADVPKPIPSCGDPLCRGWTFKSWPEDARLVACSCGRAQNDAEAQRWFRAYIDQSCRVPEPAWEGPRCAPGCRGWFLDGDTNEIHRCDECAQFAADDSAHWHVVTWLMDCRLKDGPVSTAGVICEACGGENVQHACWVSLNTNEPDDIFGDWCHGDNSYCQDCGENMPLRDLADPKADESAA